MNKNLPMIKKEGIFSKIRNLIKRLLGKENVIIQPIQEFLEEDIQKIKENSFKEGLKVKSKEIILFLQRQLEEKKIQLTDLTNEQLEELIELYDNQIKETKEKIDQNKRKIEKYKKQKEE